MPGASLIRSYDVGLAGVTYVHGQFVPGAMVSLELSANVQPILLEDSDFAGGAQLRSLVKAYVPRAPT